MGFFKELIDAFKPVKPCCEPEPVKAVKKAPKKTSTAKPKTATKKTPSKAKPKKT